MANQPIKSIVLVHGAFADGSCWNDVIPHLLSRGLQVISVQNPLTSLADDVRAVKQALDRIDGPCVLAAHSWGGAVITEAGDDDRVASLVYVAAFAPDKGSSVEELAQRFPAAPALANAKPDKNGFFVLSREIVDSDFAQDLPEERRAALTVAQGPTALKCLTDRLSNAAWENKPCWYVIAEDDRTVSPDLQRAVAKKMDATVMNLRCSHVAMMSKPKDVAAAILAAAGVTATARPERAMQGQMDAPR